MAMPPKPPAPGFGGGPPPAKPPMSPVSNVAEAAPAVGDDMKENAEEAQPNVTPEEQEQYDLFVGNALNMIAKPENKGVRDAVLESLGASSDFVMNLAETSLKIVEAVKSSGEQNGQKFGADILLHGGYTIVQSLAELASAKKIHDYAPEEIENAYYKAVDMYREGHKGELDPEQAKGELQQLSQAEQQGQADAVAPGLSETAAMIQQQGQQKPAQKGAPPPEGGEGEPPQTPEEEDQEGDDQ